MTPAYVSRRRADEFDALLSAPAREHAAAYDELLELVGELRAVPPVSARAEFVADLRSQLVVEAARLARPVDDAVRLRLTPRQRQGARERRLATALGGFAIVAASGSMAMASQAALPGDVLYPVKRALENAHTNLQSDEVAKAKTLIGHAEKRLQEAEQLTAEGADASTVAETLQDFTEQSNQATELVLDDYEATGDQDAIGELRSFTAQSMGELDALGEVVPTDARAALIAAAQSVLQADEAAFQLCPTCGDGAGLTELPGFVAGIDNVAQVTPLLDGDTGATAVLLPQGYVDKVEDTADETPTTKPPKDRKGDDSPVTDTEPSDGTAPTPGVDPDPDAVTNPLQQLGDKIKDGLSDPDHSDDLDDVVVAVDEVVGGLTGLVDGLLGN